MDSRRLLWFQHTRHLYLFCQRKVSKALVLCHKLYFDKVPSSSLQEGRQRIKKTNNPRVHTGRRCTSRDYNRGHRNFLGCSRRWMVCFYHRRPCTHPHPARIPVQKVFAQPLKLRCSCVCGVVQCKKGHWICM